MNENHFYTSLEKDLSAQRIIMNKAIDTVLNQEVTNYPIVVLHQADVELGVLLMDGGTVYSKWEIRISSLEEMVAKKVMRSDRVEDFSTALEWAGTQSL